MEHTREEHLKNLSCLCRICGKIWKTKAKSVQKIRSCVKYLDLLKERFGIDVNDDVQKYPPNICEKCYRKLIANKGNVQSDIYCEKTGLFDHCEFEPNVPIKDCAVCSHYLLIKKGPGRPSNSSETCQRIDGDNTSSLAQCDSVPHTSVDYDNEINMAGTSCASSYIESLVDMAGEHSLTEVDNLCSVADTSINSLASSIPESVEMFDIDELLNSPIEEPCTAFEEDILTHLLKKKLYQSKDGIITCKTGGPVSNVFSFISYIL